jgi:hypothetical protein
MFTTYEALRIIPFSAIEDTAIVLHSQIFVKVKNDGRTSARLAVNGKHQPPDSYTDTYAGTSDSTNRAFLRLPL